MLHAKGSEEDCKSQESVLCLETLDFIGKCGGVVIFPALFRTSFFIAFPLNEAPILLVIARDTPCSCLTAIDEFCLEAGVKLVTVHVGSALTTGTVLTPLPSPLDLQEIAFSILNNNIMIAKKFDKI